MQFDKTIINLNIKSIPDFVSTRKHGTICKLCFHFGKNLQASSSNESGEITETGIRKTFVSRKFPNLSLKESSCERKLC
jgi:hypothetical protein